MKLYVREYAELPIHHGSLSPMGCEPGLADQVVDYSGGVDTSEAFNSRTQFVRLNTDGVCSFVFGKTPVATTDNARMAADQTEYFEIPKGQGYKVSAIGNV